MNKLNTSSRESSLCLTPTQNTHPSHAQKLGTLIPNRIFVGGISNDTSENELKFFFSAYGCVKDCKIILDRGGVSKRCYGFVTFENQEDAERILKKEGQNLMFKDKKLNVGPAIRKQPAGSKLCEPSLPATTAYIYQNGTVAYPAFQNNMTVLCHPDGYILSPQTQASYPVLLAPQSASGPATVGYFSPSAAGFAQGAWPQSQWRWATSQAQPGGVAQTGSGTPTAPLLYPVAVNPSDLMFTQMAPLNHVVSPMVAQPQPPERLDASASSSSMLDHNNNNECDVRDGHFARIAHPRNQPYMI